MKRLLLGTTAAAAVAVAGLLPADSQFQCRRTSESGTGGRTST